MNIEELRNLRKTLDRKSIAFKSATLVLGDAEMEAKRSGSEDVSAIVRKHLKGVNEVLSLTYSQEMLEDKEFLESLLPTQLTTEELVAIISEQGITSLGEAHKFLKTNYSGFYDGKTATAAIKQCI